LLFEAEDDHPWWRFRRILDRSNFEAGFVRSDVSVVNWPQNDYWFGPVVGVDLAEQARNLEAARQLSLSLLYWLQTEAPRPDGGLGHPGLRLRGDVVRGTPDGLAPAAYVRESRRLRAEFTVLEQHIAHPLRPDGPERFDDSVGIGCYRIDLHPRVSGAGYLDLGCWPFQIPLGAMIPVRVENLLPGGKNLGVTHITNGAFRVHPVEWNVGGRRAPGGVLPGTQGRTEGGQEPSRTSRAISVTAGPAGVGIVSRADLLEVFIRSDEAIWREIMDDVIVGDFMMDPSRFFIDVVDGVVVLQGRVERSRLIPFLVRAVHGVEGVVRVEDRLTFDVDDRDTDMAPSRSLSRYL
jgi:FAD-dependent oxidoreductase family protein